MARLAAAAIALAEAPGPGALTGCCSGASEQPTHAIAEMRTTATTAAAAVPAEWLWVVPSGQHPDGAGLRACLDGRVDGLALSYAVVELTPAAIALAGVRVVDLRDGEIPGGVAADGRVEALYEAAFSLRESAADLAAAGCRPWTMGAGVAAPPEGADVSAAPPLLVAADGRLPARTLARTLSTLRQAGWSHLLMLVDDPAPQPITAVDPGAEPDTGGGGSGPAGSRAARRPGSIQVWTRGLVDLGRGSVSDAVGALARAREAGEECPVVSIDVEGGSPSEASPRGGAEEETADPGAGGGTELVLAPGVSVPAIELFFPGIATTGTASGDIQMLTGARCSPVFTIAGAVGGSGGVRLTDIDLSGLDLLGSEGSAAPAAGDAGLAGVEVVGGMVE